MGPRVVAALVLLAALLALAAIAEAGSRSPGRAAVGPAAEPGSRVATVPRPDWADHAPPAARPLKAGIPTWIQTLPFPRDRANRPPHADEVPSLYDDGYLCSVGCRPPLAELGWPLRPFHGQHPIRAGLNELRPRSLHVGLDIQARDGAQVYAVQPGTAEVLAASGPDARVEVGNYVYWHIVPRVKTGASVVPFHTVLGTVMARYGHIAFSELGAGGEYVNPLRPQGRVLAPYVDRRAPVIGRPAVDAAGQVVVPAYDPQTAIAWTTYLTPVLAPAALAYRLYDQTGAALTPLQWSFRGTHLLPWPERSEIYAPGARAPGYTCFATRPLCVPHWSYRLAGGLAPPLPATLPPGHYRLTIYAWDWADNATARDVRLTLTSAGWKPLGHFPAGLKAADLLWRQAVPAAVPQAEYLPPADYRPQLDSSPPADGSASGGAP